MKTLIAALALTVVIASPALARGICLNPREIVSTHSEDGKLLSFKLRDGRTLVNHLQGACSDLRYEGFVWTLSGTQEICEFEQSLKVINSGQTCTLGKFDEAKPKPKAAP